MQAVPLCHCAMAAKITRSHITAPDHGSSMTQNARQFYWWLVLDTGALIYHPKLPLTGDQGIKTVFINNNTEHADNNLHHSKQCCKPRNNIEYFCPE